MYYQGRQKVENSGVASLPLHALILRKVAILRATSGMERRDLLIATAKLQLFQGQESIRGY